MIKVLLSKQAMLAALTQTPGMRTTAVNKTGLDFQTLREARAREQQQ